MCTGSHSSRFPSRGGREGEGVEGGGGGGGGGRSRKRERGVGGGKKWWLLGKGCMR